MSIVDLATSVVEPLLHRDPRDVLGEVSLNGGRWPRWGLPGSGELYYVAPDGAMMAATVELSPTLRSTVVLVSLQGLSHDEAGVILGCPPGTVAWRMHEARARLRIAVDGGAPASEGDGAPLLGLVPALRGTR